MFGISLGKLPFCIDMLTDDTVDVGKINTDHRDNFHYDDDFNYMVVFKSLIKKKGQESTIKCRREELMGPFQVGNSVVYVLRPSPSYFFGAVGLFSDEVLGEIIELIINECNGHIEKGEVELTEIDKAYLLDVLKKKYMTKIKQQSIKLLSKSVMGKMIADTIHEHERVMTDRDILQNELNLVDQESIRKTTRTGRQEALTEVEKDAKSIKDVGFVQVIKEKAEKK